MINRKWLVLFTTIILIVTLAGLALTSCTASPAPTTAPATQTTQAPSQPKTLTIGLIASATGMMSAAFKSEIDGIKPAEDLINEQGGVKINGQQYNIKVEMQDDQSSPQGCLTAANKLVQDGVKFVVGPLFIPNIMAVLPVFDSNKIIYMQPQSPAYGIFTDKYRYAFNGWSYTFNVPSVDKYVLSKYPNIKKVALIYPDDPGVIGAHDLTIQSAKDLGLQIVFDQAYDTATQDYAPIMAKALATKPDAINVIFSIEPWAQGLITSARQLGFNGPIYAPCMFGDINIVNHMINPEYAHDIVNAGPDLFSPKMPDIVKKFRTMVEAQVKTSPFNLTNIIAIEGLLPLVQGINKAQSLDPDKVVSAMENMPSFDCLWGKGVPAGPDKGGNHNLLLPIPISILSNNGKEVITDFLPKP
jgi:ABC-type branched-subunit amino acid transport system substrate-binding protein